MNGWTETLDQLRAENSRLRAACQQALEELNDRYDYAPDVGESPWNGAGEIIRILESALRAQQGGNAGGKLSQVG